MSVPQHEKQSLVQKAVTSHHTHIATITALWQLSKVGRLFFQNFKSWSRDDATMQRKPKLANRTNDK